MKTYNDGVEPGGVYRFSALISYTAGLASGVWTTVATVTNANIAYFTNLYTPGVGANTTVRMTLDGVTISSAAVASASNGWFIDYNSDTISKAALALGTPALLGVGVPVYAGYATIEVMADADTAADELKWYTRVYQT